ncbi:MAG: transglutaminase domain-containing protein [Desulfobacteraceae bacterium]|nr:MAG: transglutaminase domain-containing protein [Desulfobacteraceae bacterium]
MEKNVLADHDHPSVIRKAMELTVGATCDREKIHRIFLYVRDGIRFGFPSNGDLVKASDTIRTGTGQCNTKSTLFLALSRAAGIPTRVHFSSIKKEIQRGLFTGIAYALMPDTISHSWAEVLVDRTWHRIDSFINDMSFYLAGKEELKKRQWNIGFSISCEAGDSSAELHLDDEKFVQMGAVVDDHGVWDEPLEYYCSPLYQNRPGMIKLLMYRLSIKAINKRVQGMREGCVKE